MSHGRTTAARTAATATAAAAVGGAVLALAAGASAQVGVYRHRAAHERAAEAGGIDHAQDFASLTIDTPFRAGPADLSGGMTVRQVGETTLLDFRNLLDSPPVDFLDNNGTGHLSGWVDHAVPGSTGIELTITFERPVRAWGADFWGANSGEGLSIDVYGRGGALLGAMAATRDRSDEWEFLGFVAPVGERVERVVFRSRRRVFGTGGEGFGMDNLALRYAEGGEPCRADCDTTTGAGVLDIFDFLCFLNRFGAGARYACDCDTASGAGVCDVFDFLCFQSFYGAGCR